MTFDFILRDDISSYSWVFFGLSFFHWVFGFHYLYKQIFSYENDEAETNNTDYNDNRDRFYAEYDRCNPITQAAASKEYIRFLKSKNQFIIISNSALAHNPSIAGKLGNIFNHLGLKDKKKEEEKNDENGNEFVDIFARGVTDMNLGGLDNYADQHDGLESYGG